MAKCDHCDGTGEVLEPSRTPEEPGRMIPCANCAERPAATTPRTKRYWLCPCGTRNPRTKQKCANEDCNRRRPKRRVPKHARTLRDDPYPVYEAYSREVHGGEPDSCRVCGRPRPERMRHHRDHDHVTGLPRGVVCYQCNALMPRLMTVERCRQVLSYLERDAAHRASERLTG